MNDSEHPTGIAVGPRGRGTGPAEPQWHFEDLPDGTEPATDAPTRLVSLGEIGAAINRSKRLWCITAVVGLLLGGALFIATKPSYQVTVSVLITNDPSQDPVSQQSTNQLLAEAPTLGAMMVKQLGLNETPAAFIKTYTVTVTSNEVLTIALSASSAGVATSQATSLATEFLKYRAEVLENQQSAEFAAQNQQSAQEQQIVSSLEKQVSKVQSGTAPSGQGTSLANLQAQQTKATDALAALQQAVASNQATTRIVTTSMISGSGILSTSLPVLVHSQKKTLLEYVGGGLLAGLVLGMTYVAIRAIVTDRPRRRADIAEALGAPVRITVVAAGGGRRLRGRGRAGHRADKTRRVVGYLRSALHSNTKATAALAVVAVDNATAAASMVADLAGACAHEGKRVVVADLSGGSLAGQLGVSTLGIHTVTINQERVLLTVPEPDDLAPIGPVSRKIPAAAGIEGLAAAFSKADILITLVTLDPAVGADHLSTWTNEAVAVVTAGASTTVKLHATGEMIRCAGIHLTSAILLGADRKDESLGAVS